MKDSSATEHIRASILLCVVAFIFRGIVENHSLSDQFGSHGLIPGACRWLDLAWLKLGFKNVDCKSMAYLLCFIIE